MTKAILDLENGSSLNVQLVRAGSGGYSVFTYISDDPATFPAAAHVYNSGGAERQQQDLALALAPPR